MDNIIISFNVVFPLLVMMAVGYILRKKGLLPEETSSLMNKIVFRIFLPCMLFKNVYDSDLSGGFNFNLLWWPVVFIVGIFIILAVAIPFFIKENPQRSVVLQGCFRSNFVIYGVPVTISLLGEANVGVTAILIAVVVPLYNFLAILSFQLFGDSKINIKKFIIGIVTNPLIIVSLVGLGFLALKINIPSVFGEDAFGSSAFYEAIAGLGKVATPLSFVLLGSTFRFASVKAHLSMLTFTVLMRLAILPAIGITLSYFLGFRGADFVTLMVLFSTPNAVSSYTMAQELGGDYELAGEIVVFTSAFSIISMFLIIFICKQMCLF